MKHILAIVALLFAFTAQAADLYYCKCDTGSSTSPACVAGSDGNSGTSAAQAKQTAPTESTLNSAAAGDRFLFCRGGAWTGLSMYTLENMNATAANRLTLDAYTASFGATDRPILQWTGGTDGFHIGGDFAPPLFDGNTTDDKGYILRSLHLKPGTTGSGTGIHFIGLVSDVLLEDLEVDSWHIGTLTSRVSGKQVTRVTLRNSYYHDMDGDGWQGTSFDQTLIENNTFQSNNKSSDTVGGSCDGSRCHAMYLGAEGSSGGTTRLTVRGNILTNNSVGTSTNCSGGNITLHGQYDQVLIEGNVVTEATWASGCGGISILKGYISQEFVRRAIVRGNTVAGSFNNGAIYNDFGTGMIIENNRVIKNLSSYTNGKGILIVDNGGPNGDDRPDNVVIRNNTCYDQYSNQECISVAVRSGHTVINNLVYTGASAAANCFQHTTLGNYATWDYNHCHRAGSGNWSSTYTTLANAQAASFDINGSQGDPLFNNTPSSGNNWDLSVQAGSPVVGTGTNTNKPIRDVLWCNRKNPPDKGAHDRGASPCLTIRAPSAVR